MHKQNAGEHTQGEWSVDGYNTTAVIAKQENGSYKHICNCDYGYTEPLRHLDNNKANAKLIAAAPDMLEALKKGLTDMEDWALYTRRFIDGWESSPKLEGKQKEASEEYYKGILIRIELAKKAIKKATK